MADRRSSCQSFKRDRGTRVVGCLILLMGLPLAVCGQSGSEPNQASNVEAYLDSDAYQIYGVLLDGVKDSFLVIQAETDSWSGAKATNMGIKGDAKFMKSWGDVIGDYAKQYQKPKLLVSEMKIAVPYEVVSKLRIYSLFRAEGGWDGFYKRYPGSGGFYSFSAVGFNRAKTRAIVEMNRSCGPLCGGGSPHFLEKKGGKWQEVSVDALITVWAS